MIGDIRSSVAILDIYYVFLLSSLYASAGFSNVIPRTVITSDLVNNISLEMVGLPEFWGRKLLLWGSIGCCDNLDIFLSDKSCKWFGEAI